MPIVLIEQGIVREDNLAAIKRDRAWLDGELARRGFNGAGDIFCADWHADRLWTYPYERPTAPQVGELTSRE